MKDPTREIKVHDFTGGPDARETMKKYFNDPRIKLEARKRRAIFGAEEENPQEIDLSRKLFGFIEETIDGYLKGFEYSKDQHGIALAEVVLALIRMKNSPIDEDVKKLLHDLMSDYDMQIFGGSTFVTKCSNIKEIDEKTRIQYLEDFFIARKDAEIDNRLIYASLDGWRERIDGISSDRFYPNMEIALTAYYNTCDDKQKVKLLDETIPDYKFSYKFKDMEDGSTRLGIPEIEKWLIEQEEN